jgi:hypothetical protein
VRKRIQKGARECQEEEAEMLLRLLPHQPNQQKVVWLDSGNFQTSISHFFFKQFCLIFGFEKIRLIRLAPTLLHPVYCLEFELHFEGLEFV